MYGIAHSIIEGPIIYLFACDALAELGFVRLIRYLLGFKHLGDKVNETLLCFLELSSHCDNVLLAFVSNPPQRFNLSGFICEVSHGEVDYISYQTIPGIAICLEWLNGCLR